MNKILRLAFVTVLLLLIPLAGNQFVEGWNWSLFDFVWAGTLFFGSGLLYELVSRKMSSGVYRAAVGLAVVTAFLLIWINAAVGIIGDGDFPNGMYLVMFAVGFVAALIARFQPRGMSYILFAMAAAQMCIPTIALLTGTPDFSPGVVQVFGLNAIFAVLWVGSAFLFLHADATRVAKQ
jgi:hypothetical protein